jgi:hypothetical protein
MRTIAKSRVYLLLTALAFLVLASSVTLAEEESPESRELMKRVATPDRVLRANAALDRISPGPVASVWLVRELSRAYATPFHLERVAVDDSGRSIEPEYPFRLRDLEPLESALSRAKDSSQGELAFEPVGKSIVIRELAGGSPEENILDRRVSVRLSRSSYWEATRAIARAATAGRGGARVLHISAPMAGSGLEPPESFVAEGTVDFDVENVTAREAFCMLFEDVPLRIRYGYFHTDYPAVGPRADMYLHFVADTEGAVSTRRLTREEMGSWNTQGIFRP